ncbi:hypothetical protein D3C87_1708490 [compost metagenome]
MERKDFGAFVLDQTGHGAARQGIANVRAAVGGRAGPGNEAVTGPDLAAVGLQRAGHRLAQPGNGVVHRIQQGQCARHSDSSTASATICGLTAMSGCTPIMRSVC